MPNAGARTLADLISEAQERLIVECPKCGRHGDYSVAKLVITHGVAMKMPDLLVFLSQDCLKRGGSIWDACGAQFRL